MSGGQFHFKCVVKISFNHLHCKHTLKYIHPFHIFALILVAMCIAKSLRTRYGYKYGVAKFISQCAWGRKHTFLSNTNNDRYIKWTIFSLSFLCSLVQLIMLQQAATCKKFKLVKQIVQYLSINKIIYTGSNKWNQKASIYHNHIHFWLRCSMFTHSYNTHIRHWPIWGDVQWSCKAVGQCPTKWDTFWRLQAREKQPSSRNVVQNCFQTESSMNGRKNSFPSSQVLLIWILTPNLP